MTQVINCQIINFPNCGNEMIVENEDGSYTVLINAKLSYVGRLRAYEHAIRHIKNCDFEKDDVQKIEFNAHEN